MKTKLLIFLTSMLVTGAFAQSKSSGVVTLQPNMTANFTLDNATSKVTLILTGPSDRWFGLGIGVEAGFGMSAGDVLVYSTTLTDRRYGGTGNPPTDASQDWTVVSNEVTGAVRTLNLTRNLTNTDNTGSDFQMPYATTNSFSIVGVRPGSATTAVGSHGGSASAGYAVATLTALGVEDVSLSATSIYPNPSNGNFNVVTKTSLNEINVFSHTGALIKTIKVSELNNAAVSIEGLQTGVYLIELKNDTEKSWKKIIVE